MTAKMLPVLVRQYSASTSCDAARVIFNRNPRNLERLCIARKPDGWHLEKPGLKYWHKIEVTKSARHVTASVVHFSGAVPVTCSTKEWALRKHLYSTSDTAAYVNLGRFLGIRCLEAGINEMSCFLDRKDGGKVDRLLKEMETLGVVLTEPAVYVHPQASDLERPEKPWTVHV